MVHPDDEATAPLILTLALDGGARERFDHLRRAHFPPARNLVPAHLTLFHHLPADRERAIVADIEETCGLRGGRSSSGGASPTRSTRRNSWPCAGGSPRGGGRGSGRRIAGGSGPM